MMFEKASAMTGVVYLGAARLMTEGGRRRRARRAERERERMMRAKAEETSDQYRVWVRVGERERETYDNGW